MPWLPRGKVPKEETSNPSHVLSYTTHPIFHPIRVLSIKFMQEEINYNHELIEAKLGPKTLLKKKCNGSIIITS